MDIASRLQQLEELITEAKSMPLSSSVLVNQEEILEIIRAIGEDLPEEIKQARWVVKDREALLAKARKDAQALIDKALEEQVRLASREEVVKRSEAEAERILAEAREQARQIRLEAEDYIDAKLAAFEAALGKVREDLGLADADLSATSERLDKTGQAVEKARQRLRGGTIAEEELAGG